MDTTPHIYKVTHWESNGRWRVNDVTNLCGKSAKWYAAMRLLSLSVDEYINLLVNTFHAIELKYFDTTDCLIFCFKTETEAKAYCNYINKQARLKHFYVY